MQKQRLINGVISGALVGGLILGSVGLVSAATDSSSSDQSSNTKPSIAHKMSRGPGHDRGMGMDLDLTVLVEDGIITSAESTAIQNKIDELNADRKAEMEKIQAMTETERQTYFKDNKPEKTELLTTLVDEGIISSTQAEAIQDSMQTKRQQAMQTNLTNKLNSLVEKGTINTEQSALILTALQAQKLEKTTDMEKVKAMTETERKAYFQQNAGEKTNPLASLVTAGSITQAQADAVMQASSGRHGEGKGPGKAPANNAETKTNSND